MEMNQAVGATPLDGNADPVVGLALARVDGPLKVSGRATYAAEFGGQGEVAYGVLAPSPVARGRIVSVDVSDAMRVPGVIHVMTHHDAPPMATRHGQILSPLSTDEISHVGQPVALAIASSFEAATEAASLVRVRMDTQAVRTGFADRLDAAQTPPAHGGPADSETGHFETAYGSAPVRVDVTYTTPEQSHIMMEPHATIASWSGDELTLMTANQMPVQGVQNVAKTLKVDPSKVRLVSRYVGGGFGSKLAVWPDAILAAIGSRAVGKPVKVVLTRPQVFSATGHRPNTLQRLRIGAGGDGRITAIAHDSVSSNNPGSEFYETASEVTRSMYAGANRRTTQRLLHRDVPLACSMRAPGEAVGSMALECAMDELADRCGLDPIELRIRNEPSEDPEKHIPFSTRHLVECYRAGAARFGWSARVSRPGQVRDGRVLVGMGMAAASRGNLLRAAHAKVALRPDGQAVAWLAMTDIGTGTYTILAQIAAEMLGLPVSAVRIELGDTSFPQTSGSGGSWGASSSGSALYEACANLRTSLAQAAGVDAATARFEGGFVSGSGVSGSGASGAGVRRAIASLVPVGGTIEAMGEIKPGTTSTQYTQRSWGAQFAEVGVDMDTGEIRVRRMLGVFTAGRILNEATARSQCYGGMTMGIGSALTEALVLDGRTGGFVNDNMAEYLVPVNADVPALDVLFLPELDPLASPIKSKGLGELGICGAAAAVANAVFNATGIRVRDFPITLDKLMPHLVAA